MGRPKNQVPAPEPPKRRWVTQAFVAEHLGVSTRTVRDMSNDGRLTSSQPVVDYVEPRWRRLLRKS